MASPQPSSTCHIMPGESLAKRIKIEKQETYLVSNLETHEVLKLLEGYGSDDDEFEEYFLTPEVGVTQRAIACSNCTPSHEMESSSIKTEPANQSPATDSTFTEETRLLTTPKGNKPIEYFSLLFNKDFYNLLEEEINNHANGLIEQNLCLKELKDWDSVTRDDLKLFIGLKFLMGILQLENLSDYWDFDKELNLKFFSKKMTYKRYRNIMQTFSCTNDSCSDDVMVEDPVYKVTPLIDHFVKTMAKIYYPGHQMYIDESVIGWKGKLSYCRYKKLNKYRSDVKLYLLSEPDGLINRFLVYAGADIDLAKYDLAKELMCKLLNGFERDHRSFENNVPNYINFSQQLEYEIDSANRTGNSQNINRENTKMIQHSTSIELNNGKGVPMESDFSENDETVPHKSRHIMNQIKKISGIDRLDQYLSHYSVRSRLQWHKKLSFHVMELMMLNAFILHHRYSNEPTDMKSFRLSVISSLCDQALPSSIINFQNHFPSFIKEKLENPKFCKLCLIEKNKRVPADLYCADCEGEPPLCLRYCYREYHRQYNNIL